MRSDQCCKCGSRTLNGECAGCRFTEDNFEEAPVLAPDESWGDEATDDNVRAIEAHEHSAMFAQEAYVGDIE